MSGAHTHVVLARHDAEDAGQPLVTKPISVVGFLARFAHRALVPGALYDEMGSMKRRWPQMCAGETSGSVASNGNIGPLADLAPICALLDQGCDLRGGRGADRRP